MIAHRLADRLAERPRTGSRHVLALIGAPGSGKSTLAASVAAAWPVAGTITAVLPMDGFHYDDAILDARGLRARKGAPETFDVAGFAHLLSRLRRNAEPEIAVPVFDRRSEVAHNAARIIAQNVDLLIVEGNYLLLDRPGWRDLSAHFDMSVMLDIPEAELRRRLYRRWRDQGIPEDRIAAKVEDNDMANGLTILRESRAADMVLGVDDLVDPSLCDRNAGTGR